MQPEIDRAFLHKQTADRRAPASDNSSMARNDSNPISRTNDQTTTPTPPDSLAQTPTATGGQTPSIGRIVHYQPAAITDESGAPIGVDGVKPRAAIIADADASGRVTLHVFPPNGDNVVVRDVTFADRPTPGCWSWPPRV